MTVRSTRPPKPNQGRRATGEGALEADPYAGPRAGADRLVYLPPGPVAAAFIRALPREAAGGAGIKWIFGPVGSGKTRSNFAFMLAVAAKQPPSPIDGVRRYKWGVVRQTYRDLWRSTIPSWWEQVPRDYGQWIGGRGEPAQHAIVFELPDATKLEFYVDFLALGEGQNIQDLVAGYQPSAWCFDEANQLGVPALAAAIQRCGRYPARMHGSPWWYGITCVSNAWEEDDEALMRLYADPPANMVFFRQPGGFDPAAENRHNLAPGYYEGQVALLDAMGESWRRRQQIDNEFGYSRDGKPVFETFATDRHVSPGPLVHLADRPLLIGADAGLTPALVFAQWSPEGQVRILGELCAEGMAAPDFGRLAAQVMAERFGKLAVQPQAWGDPAAAKATEGSSRSWLDLMSEAMGIRFRPAPGSNNLDKRIAVVARALRETVAGGRPGLILDPACKRLIRGFASGYRLRKIRTSGERYDTKPEKNAYSHPMDALQYVLLGGDAYADVLDRRAGLAAGQMPVMAPSDFDPLGMVH